ncbi:MAG: MSHA pilin protein MshA [Kangiellaceae bacterium]|jgi:MSHA pilin protein MshA
MKHQQGFTLIELIIVIVILGILAVTAAPRFIDIQSDARKETLQGVKAALRGASQLVYAKSAIAGVQTQEANSVVLSAGSVVTKYGYPDADAIIDAGPVTAEEVLQRFVDVELNTAEVESQLVLDEAFATDTFRIRFGNIASTEVVGSLTGCYIQYVSATETSPPTITVLDNDC